MIMSWCPGREPTQSSVSQDYTAFLGGKLATYLQSPAAGYMRLTAASANTGALVLLHAVYPLGKGLRYLSCYVFSNSNETVNLIQS